MTNVVNIRTKQTKGPKVPKTYARQGRDEVGSHTSERPLREDSLLSDTAKDRLARVGVLLATGALAITVGTGLHKLDSDSKSRNAAIERCIEDKTGEQIHVGTAPESDAPMVPAGVSEAVVNACMPGSK